MQTYKNRMILARVGDKKQTKRHNTVEIVFWRDVSEIQCVMFQQNNVNAYEFYNNYIESSIVFHTMINSVRV